MTLQELIEQAMRARGFVTKAGNPNYRKLELAVFGNETKNVKRQLKNFYQSPSIFAVLYKHLDIGELIAFKEDELKNNSMTIEFTDFGVWVETHPVTKYDDDDDENDVEGQFVLSVEFEALVRLLDEATAKAVGEKMKKILENLKTIEIDG